MSQEKACMMILKRMNFHNNSQRLPLDRPNNNKKTSPRMKLSRSWIILLILEIGQMKKTLLGSNSSLIVLLKRISKLSFLTTQWLSMGLNSTIPKKKNLKNWVNLSLFMEKSLPSKKVYKKRQKSKSYIVRETLKRKILYKSMKYFSFKIKQRISIPPKSVYLK